MNNSITIPKVIKVGFDKRRDTYTGMLAYIIYYDEKGKLRKETSWEHWRDKTIEPKEFNNVPVSGFILNKKAGDYGNGWDHRRAYCRVYDPRGFEIEITFENLMYILEFLDCCRGKGLQGELVYGWDGKDLVLIPVCSPDYMKIAEFSNKKNSGNTIKPKEIEIGKTYIDKNNNKLTYLGQFNFYDTHIVLRNTETGEEVYKDGWWNSKCDYNNFESKVGKLANWVSKRCSIQKGKRHVFVLNYGDSKYNIFKWYSSIGGKFIEQSGEISTQDIDKIIQDLMGRDEFSPIESVIIDEYSKEDIKKILEDNCCNRHLSTKLISKDGLEVQVTLNRYNRCTESVPFEQKQFEVDPFDFALHLETPVGIEALINNFKDKFKGRYTGMETKAYVTFDELYDIMKPCRIITKLASGVVYDVQESRK